MQKTGQSKGTQQTELADIPEDWEVNCLGDIFKFKNGLNKAKEYFGYGQPILNYMDVYNHSGLHKNCLVGKVDVNKDEIKAYGIIKGDVFLHEHLKR